MLYGERSAVWDQAENRLHAQKALLELLCRARGLGSVATSRRSRDEEVARAARRLLGTRPGRRRLRQWDDDDSGDGGSAQTSSPRRPTAPGGTGAKTAQRRDEGHPVPPGPSDVAKGGHRDLDERRLRRPRRHRRRDSFKSGDPGGISGGGEFKHSFDKAGSFKYVCTVHPGMEGTVVVK